MACSMFWYLIPLNIYLPLWPRKCMFVGWQLNIFLRLATYFFRYLTFERYCWINQHVECRMLIQYLQNAWQMKERHLEINIGFYLEKIDNLFKLQHHFVWDSQWPHGFPCTNYGIHVCNIHLQTYLGCDVTKPCRFPYKSMPY